MVEKLLFLDNRLTNKEKLYLLAFIFISALSTFLTILIPYFTMQFIIGHYRFIDILLIILAVQFLSLSSNYFKLNASKILFLLRLKEVANCNIKAIYSDVADIDLADGKEKINYAQEAVSYGNDYGIEAYYIACLELISALLVLFAIFILALNVSVVFILILIIATIIHIALLLLLDKRIEIGQKQWLKNRFKEEKIRRACIAEQYAKDIRVRKYSDKLLSKIKNIQEKIFSYIQYREKCRFFREIVLGLSTLLRNILAFGYIIYIYKINSEYIVLWFSVLLSVDLIIKRLAENLFSLNNNKLLFDYLLDFYKTLETKQTKELKHVFVNDGNQTILEINNLSFQYNDDKKLFTNFSAEIKKGEKIALIGHNGVGKSTLIKILAGLYQPTSGELLYAIDRSQISVAFQENHLFAFPIVENLTTKTLSQWERTEQADKDRLAELIEEFAMDRVISKKKSGIFSYCGKQLNAEGIDFSGGEKQNLSIIRAAFKEGQLLFLDEPSAALDPISESKLYQKINQIFKDKTVIFTSHRLGSTKFCERIFFIKKSGEIIDSNFSQLYNQDTEFRNLYEQQLQLYNGVS